ncbi:MAG TPA: hypothetical protein VHJ17_12185 [Thermomonospora sp.]|nr:hypothetical protein [Thermomonospora sp.]
MTRTTARVLRRIIGFDAQGMVSLFLWATRRRDGVPPGGVAVSYSREQTSTMLLWLFAMAVELVGVDIVLRAMDVPEPVRLAVLVLDAYGVLIGLAVLAACITRPHVVTPGHLRIRYGAFFDLRIPRDLITEVRHARNFNETGLVTVDDDRLAVAVASQTNLIVELSEPVTAIRPLGRRAQARTIRFFADDPRTALQALRPREEYAAEV